MQKLSVHLTFIKRCMQTKKGETAELRNGNSNIGVPKVPPGLWLDWSSTGSTSSFGACCDVLVSFHCYWIVTKPRNTFVQTSM